MKSRTVNILTLTLVAITSSLNIEHTGMGLLNLFICIACALFVAYRLAEGK